MSSSTHFDNKKKDISVLVKGPTKGLEHTLTAEKMHSINFTVTKKKFCLGLFRLFRFVKFTNLKQKILKLWQLHYV